MKNKGAWISVAIGAPLGLLLIFLICVCILVFTAAITQEGLPAISLFYFYRIPIIVMTIVFLVSLWPAGLFAEKLILKNKNILNVSFLYTFAVNVLSFLSIFLTSFVFQFDLFFSFILPLVFLSLTTLISTFTVGLLICKIIQKKVTG